MSRIYLKNNDLTETLIESTKQNVSSILLLNDNQGAPKPKHEFEASNYYNTLHEEEEEEDAVGIRIDMPKKAPKKVVSVWSKLYAKWRVMKRFLMKPAVSGIVFLCLMGFVAAILSTVTDLMITRMIQARLRFSSMTNNFWINYALHISYGLVCAYMATCCVVLISDKCTGSGVPEIKTMMSGVRMDSYLGITVALAKSLGLATALGAGFSVGRVGPFVHFCTCICHVLLKIPFFDKLRRNDLARLNMYSAASAVAIASILGAPFGGVLFSIELMSNYYMVSTFAKGVACALFGSFFFSLVRTTGIISVAKDGVAITLFPTDFSPFPFHVWEYGTFALLGVFCGLIGALYNAVGVRVSAFVRQFMILREARFSIVLPLCLLFSAIDFHFSMLKNTPSQVLNELFTTPKFAKTTLYFTIPSLLVIKFIMTQLSNAIPIPSSIITPGFIMGAMLGRVFGEVVHLINPTSVAAGYAVVGACAMTSSITRTLSIIVIMFEVTGQLSYLIPMLACTVIAVSLANVFNESLFVKLIYLKKLPYVPIKDPEFGSNTLITKYIDTDLHFVTPTMTIQEIEAIVKQHHHHSYPIVETEKNKSIIGEVKRLTLQRIIRKYHKEVRVSASLEQTPDLSAYTAYYEHDLTEADQGELDDELDRTDLDALTYTIEDPKNAKEAKYMSLNKMGHSMKIVYEPSPFCIQKFTQLNKVHFLFTMLGLSHAWVVHRGALVGVLTKKNLIEAIDDLEKRKVV